MQRKTSSALMQRAQLSIPGGVNSPVRAFKGVGGDPIFFSGAQGAYLSDVDGNRYIDYIGSWGPMILGHNFAPTVKAVTEQAQKALSFGAPTEIEIELAEKIVSRVPSMERVRMVNSGTEATMSAIRLARGFTNRDMIVKFSGCYHGHSDSLLVKAGSGVLTLGLPNSPGVPEDLAKHTLTAPFNDAEAIGRLMATYGDRVACIIVEPIAGNMGCIPPAEDYLQKTRQLCDQYGVVLILDEVMTGCRVAYGSSQEIYGIKADMTCFGKVIGGGLPLAAYGGKKEIMQHLAPVGKVYQAGTLSGNPLAVSAGCATLEMLPKSAYDKLTQTTTRYVKMFEKALSDKGITHSINQVGSMFGIFFQPEAPSNFTEISTSHVEMYKKFFHALLDEGVYIAPSAYEACFMSLAHDDEAIESMTQQAVERAVQKL